MSEWMNINKTVKIKDGMIKVAPRRTVTHPGDINSNKNSMVKGIIHISILRNIYVR
ncbi:hypothetical protein SDC9_112059 [bioreactor metagenome]|uniref:Uncharacterized protein n=1 Tax=bioreactor metagenome TaxID=1076179 RepID=A0A645BIG8_9ZZZZ